MRHEEYLIITDDYGFKYYEIYITPFKLTILSYDHGGQLSSEQISKDDCLKNVLNPYLYSRLEGT